jgi:asparagine synthase (glutamine-hydrolysing)
MCGIAGAFASSRREPVTEADLRQMLAMIRHRGPDQFGIYLGPGVGLGSARLSIIDLEGGQQPISNEDGTLWIVFNGEIFNYVELRRELEARGHRFATHTDTEVIVHLYEDYGPECLSRLNGQFAIAIWNKIDRSLFLARDRLGVRPLFYAEHHGTIVFGSEIKAILAHPEMRPELDPISLEQVFVYWSTLSPRSCFRGILSVPPAHYLFARGDTVRVTPYWQMRFPEDAPDREGKDLPTEQYVEELQALLVDATRLRLRADVPVGAYLSGGLDSSAIAAIIRRFGSSNLDTFSIAFSDPKFDEAEFQRRMAQFLGTEHQVVVATYDEIGRIFPEVIWHTETPVMRTSPAPMFLLSKLVRDRGYKVVLTGEGADEFLAGYDLFKEAMIRRFWARRPNSKWRSLLLKRLYHDVTGLGSAGEGFLKAFFSHGLTEVDRPDYSHAIRWRNNRRTCRFFSEDLQASIARSSGEGPKDAAVPPEFAKWGCLARAQYLECSIFLSQYLLSSQGDRMAMAHSVEGRFPFLDYRVVEFCNRVPARLKLRGLTEKYLLRRAVRDWVPPDILRRVKRPYRAPIHRSFFNSATAEYLRELLSTRALRAAGLFNSASVSQLVTKLEQGRSVSETDDMALAGIISAQLVYHQFISHFKKPPPLGPEDDVKVVSSGESATPAPESMSERTLASEHPSVARQ